MMKRKAGSVRFDPYFKLQWWDELSMAPTYEAFLEMLYAVVSETRRVLRPGSPAVWVVGLHRDKAGSLLPLHHDLARLHAGAGFRFKEEIVLAQRNNGAIQRVGNFERGDRRLVRIHEYALVFEVPRS